MNFNKLRDNQMSGCMSLRVLICDPEKASRRRLLDCLAINPCVDESAATDSMDDLMELLEARKINLLFIDPICLNLRPASRLIFEIREQLPGIVICLYVGSSNLRHHFADFYEGERERFEHYFNLDKELAGVSFGEEVYQMVPRCLDAAHRMSFRPIKIRLMTQRPGREDGSRPERNFSVQPQRAVEKPDAAIPAKPKPVRGFFTPLPDLGNLGRNYSQP
jgi:hypothetical protein